MKYVVYLTMYNGDKMPKWYIGSSNQTKVSEGYNGSISSKKYKNTYINEQKQNKSLFKTRILSYHLTRKDALIEELRVQKIHKVVRNDRYINMSYASINGFFGRDVSGENNPMYDKKHNIDSLNKMSQALMNQYVSEQTRQKISKIHKGKPKSKEQKDKISKSNIGKIITQRQKDKISKTLTGYKHSDETKKKMSMSNKGKTKSKEHKKKIGNSVSGSSNGNGKLIDIYDSKGKLLFECNGNFKKTCIENNLPEAALTLSYHRNGEPIWQLKRLKTSAKRNNQEQFIGYYSKIKDKE